MQKVGKLKRRADSMLEDVFRALFEEIDTDKIRAEIAALRAAAPADYDPAGHARILARRTAIRCAAAGAVTGIPSIGILAIGTIGADLAYLMYQQFRMIVGIATIYGHEPSSRERFTEALSCLAYSSSVGLGKQGLAVVKARFTRLVPIVGAVSGSALNYLAVHAVARAAIRYYESRVDPNLAEEIWAEGDREHA
ncbi:MAG: hypothetical protein ACXW2P_03650 [Thermoanaerobaculia bacterium]